jgi:DNA repair exonuclease SbcCD ATPase subunit/DNA repair exonuclease SbcCD nuclease subunit
MIKKIMHLSDIHIRLQQRHKEYRHVFRNFYKHVVKQRPDIIVISGDIFHQKVHLSPEAIKVAGEFFTKLSTLAPVHMIIGNHDTIVSQKGRIDSVTAVLNLANLDNIYLYTKSGLYEVDNIVFGVFDINDDKKWPYNPDKEDGKSYVALFHGPINNSVNEVKFSMESKYKLDMFDGYDVAMLGDIHTRQVLQERSEGKPQVEYSGSFIQQNFAEDKSKGYLMWDMETLTSEYFEVESDYGYRTISLSKTDVDNIDIISFDLPKYPYIRVLLDHDSYDITKSKYIESHIISKYKPSYLTIEINHTKEINKANISDVHIENVVDLNVQKKILKEYLKSFPNMESDAIEEVMQVHESMYNNFTTNEFDHYKGLNWDIKRMKFSNVFSYGEDNVINFDKLRGLTGIFSANASGKSSLLYTILTAFFNMSTRASRGNIVDVINKNKDIATIDVEFFIDNKEYLIRREIKRTKKDPNRAKNTIEFYEVVGGELNNIMGTANTNATEKQIRGMLGSFEEHAMTTFSQQFDATSFIDYNQSSRKELLSKFLGLDIIENLYQSVKEETSALRRTLTEYKKYDYKIIEREYEEKEDRLQSELIELGEKKEELYYNLKEKNEKINKLHTQLKNTEGIDLDVEELNDELEYCDSEIENINNDIKTHHNTIEDTTSKLEDLEEEKKTLQPLEVIEKKRDEYNSLLSKGMKLENDITNLQKEINTSKRSVEILNMHDWFEKESVCSKCSFLQDAFSAKENLIQLEDQAKVIRKPLSEITNKLEDYDGENLDDLLERHQKVSFSIQSSEQYLQNVENQLSTYEDRLSLLEEKKTVIKDNINRYNINEHNIKINKDIQEKIDFLRKEVNETEEYIKNNIDNEINSKNIEYGQTHQQLMELSETIEKVEKIENKYNTYNILKNALSNNGIPLLIMSKVIPIINEEIRKILAKISNFDVMIEVDSIEQDLHIFIEDNISKRKVELGSGMEKTVAALAIRAALANISLLPICNLFIVDEGFGTLDAENLIEINELLQYLKTRFNNVMIISHIDVMKDVTDNIISIEKDEYGYSSIRIE